jgi:hypothetical protein
VAALGPGVKLLEGSTNASPQNILVHGPSEVALFGAAEALDALVPGSGAHVLRVLVPVAATQIPVSDVVERLAAIHRRDAIHQPPPELAGGVDAGTEAAAEAAAGLLRAVTVTTACGVPCGLSIARCEFVRAGRMRGRGRGPLPPPVGGSVPPPRPWGGLSLFEHFQTISLQEYISMQYEWEAAQVRRTPSWPRSWANFSLF